VSAAVLACSLAATDCAAQGPPSRFTLRSKAVGATYTIDVVVPQGGASDGKRLPVAYCTDWFVLADYLRSLPKLLDMGRLTGPFIMVGISEGATQHDWAMARNRDFTPARPTDAYSRENVYTPALEKAGGAGRFVAFLKDELIPLIEARFPADPARRAFVGYSLGALLGTHLLYREPGVFQYYLLGSSSLWFNQFQLATEFGSAPADTLRSIKKVYLSVGEGESWEMLKGYGMLRDALHDKGFGASRMKAEIVADAGHVGAMPISLYNGLRFLFARE